jgi:hypothetical protein
MLLFMLLSLDFLFGQLKSYGVCPHQAGIDARFAITSL